MEYLSTSFGCFSARAKDNGRFHLSFLCYSKPKLFLMDQSLQHCEAQVKHRVSFCVASAWYTLMILECRFSGYLVLGA